MSRSRNYRRADRLIEVGRWIPRAPINQIQIGIVRPMGPRGPPAFRQRHYPMFRGGIAGLGVSTDAKAAARFWNRKCIEKTADGGFATASTSFH